MRHFGRVTAMLAVSLVVLVIRHSFEIGRNAD
jgi:hypothetical protein